MTSSPSFKAVHDALGAFVDADPTYSAQLCVQIAGEPVVDLTCGAMQPDSLLPVYSSSKGATAVVVALLVERGQLDLDAARGALLARVRSVRQGRDHRQAAALAPGRPPRRRRRVHAGRRCSRTTLSPRGSPRSDRSGSRDRRSCTTRSRSARSPTSSFVASTVDGSQRCCATEVTGPRGIDVWMGTPESEDHRVAVALPPTGEELSAFLVENSRCPRQRRPRERHCAAAGQRDRDARAV